MARNPNAIYSATYSNVPVYEFNVAGNHVMRRRADDWINATHILKVADYDKPARTRILEREVQKGVHEKVQGGYGKYQGTWIPLSDGRELAQKNGVLEKLGPIFDYVPGDRSPPPAPKHETAASRPRAQKANAPRKPAAGESKKRKASNKQLMGHDAARRKTVDYDRLDVSMRDVGTPDHDTVASESAFGDYDMSQFTGGSRKRHREPDTQMSQADKDHQLWADELLDYFMLQEDGESMSEAPQAPHGANLNRPIDERGHTALHWAAAMADVEVVKDLIRRGASIDAQAKNGETPLMRAVLFTNSFDKRNMEKIAHLLIRTVNMQEWSGSTVFHHIATITHSRKKYDCARYYMDCIINKMAEMLSPTEMERVLNEQDASGDTAITIAARTGARKCVRSLLGRNAAVEIPNHAGETADQLIVQLNNRRAERSRQLSSSPFQEIPTTGGIGGAVQPPNGIPFDPLVLHSSLNGASQVNGNTVYRSEAALTLTSQVMPLVFSKAKALANSIEQELARKEEELREAEHALELRRAEIAALSAHQEQLIAHQAKLAAGPTDEELIQQLRELEAECEGLTKEEHDFALHQLIDQNRANMDVDMHPYDTMDEEAMLESKERLVNELVIIRKERESLIKEIVKNLSVAGMSDRQNEYKRLITGALGVKEEDVESMLPEIVAELEDAQQMEQVGA